MKFTANRRTMAEHLKTMLPIVPKNAPAQELKGFLIEANEDDGYLYMTANNLEVAIQRKLKPNVETGGNFVMEAKMLYDILTHLGGDEVLFEEIKPGTIIIKSDRCTYTMPVLNSRIYPRPNIPFPDSTFNICNVKQMYSKTYSAVGGNGASESMRGIHFNIGTNGFKLESCNLKDIAVTETKMNCGGNMEFMLAKQTVSYLATAAENEDLEVGFSGSSVVFMKEGMLFSARMLATDFVDINKILGALKTDYTAAVNGYLFKEKILNICEVAAMGSESSYIRLNFEQNRIDYSTENEMGTSNGNAECVTAPGVFGMTFFYSAADLKTAFKTVEDKMLLRLDKRGFMILSDEHSKFMLTPVPDRAVKKQLEKVMERKSKPKRGKKEQTAAVAA